MKLRDCCTGGVETPHRDAVYDRKEPGTVRDGRKHEARFISNKKTKSSKRDAHANDAIAYIEPGQNPFWPRKNIATGQGPCKRLLGLTRCLY